MPSQKSCAPPRIRFRGATYAEAARHPAHDRLDELTSRIHRFGLELRDAVDSGDAGRALSMLDEAERSTPAEIDKLRDAIRSA